MPNRGPTLAKKMKTPLIDRIRQNDTFAGRDAPGDIDHVAASASAASAAKALKARSTKDSLLGRVVGGLKAANNAVDNAISGAAEGTWKRTPAIVKLPVQALGGEQLVRDAHWSLSNPIDRILGRGRSSEQSMEVPFSKRIPLGSGRELVRVRKINEDKVQYLRNKMDVDGDEAYFGWTGDVDQLYRPRHYRTPHLARVAYNLKEQGKTIGSIKLTAQPNTVHVDEVFIQPEHRGVGPMKDLFGIVKQWMEQAPDGTYKRAVDADLANPGINKVLAMEKRRDPNFRLTPRLDAGIEDGIRERNANRQWRISDRRYAARRQETLSEGDSILNDPLTWDEIELRDPTVVDDRVPGRVSNDWADLQETLSRSMAEDGYYSGQGLDLANEAASGLMRSHGQYRASLYRRSGIDSVHPVQAATGTPFGSVRVNLTDGTSHVLSPEVYSGVLKRLSQQAAAGEPGSFAMAWLQARRVPDRFRGR